MSAPGSEHLLMMSGGDPLDELGRIEHSVRLRSAATAYLTRTPVAAGNRKTWTLSMWVKRSKIAAHGPLLSANSNVANGVFFGFTPEGTSNYDILNVAINGAGSVSSSALFRDTSAWCHLLLAFDTTNATEKQKVYFNGGLLFTANIGTLNGNFECSNTIPHRIGYSANGNDYFDGYLSEINFIDGGALDPSSFGSFHPRTGQWRPKKYTGTYGTNGFHLDFSDGSAATAAALGADRSGNGNNWAPTNISVTAGVTQDWMLDTPTDNCATFNRLMIPQFNTAMSNGNLQVTSLYPSYNAVGRATVPVSSTRAMQAEMNLSAFVGNAASCGVIANGDIQQSLALSSTAVAYLHTGQQRVAGATSAYGTAWTTQTIGVVTDPVAKTVTFYRDGVSQGAISAPQVFSGDYFIQLFCDDAANVSLYGNFGQRAYAFPVTGAGRVSTKNLPVATAIMLPKKHFDVATYLGNGGTKVVSGVGFRPDWAWLKCRDIDRVPGVLDVVRGALKYLLTHMTDAEVTGASTLESFNDDGFTLGSSGTWNTNGNNFMAWLMKAGGAPVANSAGTIASQVSANPLAGFSIVAYTGTGVNGTVGHGLGVAPKMVIVKRRTAGSTQDWEVFHAGLANTSRVQLNRIDAAVTSTTSWNSTSPAADVFSVGTHANTNQSGIEYIAYCFAEVPGFSKFGTYTGNYSGDGPFVYCGFQPRFVLIKRADSGSEWQIMDTARSPYNVAVAAIEIQNALQEDVSGNADKDFLSSGFKVRSLSYNQSGGTFIFAAFAEFPFRYANAR